MAQNEAVAHTAVAQAKGVGGQVEIVGDAVLIRRRGLMARSMSGAKRSREPDVRRSGGLGEKTIPIVEITAVRMKSPGFTTGYISFSTAADGSVPASRTGVTYDENSVIFNKGHMAEFVAVKDYVEARLPHAIDARPVDSTDLAPVRPLWLARAFVVGILYVFGALIAIAGVGILTSVGVLGALFTVIVGVALAFAGEFARRRLFR